MILLVNIFFNNKYSLKIVEIGNDKTAFFKITIGGEEI